MVSRDLLISPPVHALHFDLADWISTPAPRQLTPNKLSQLLCLLTFSRFPRWKSCIAKKNATHRESNPRLPPYWRKFGPIDHLGAAVANKKEKVVVFGRAKQWSLPHSASQPHASICLRVDRHIRVLRGPADSSARSACTARV